VNLQPNNPTRHLRRQPLWSVTLLALLLLLATGSGTAAVRASLDRDTVYADDIFTLIIESDGQSSGQPDLTPLEKNFEVLGTSTSTQVSIFNGRRSDKMRWHVQLQPRHHGQLQIPPIEIGGQRTNAITLEVSEAPQQPVTQAGQHVFIESEVGTGDKPVYVQQQIPYTVRLYYDGHLQGGELSAPEPENTVVERLGKEKSYNTVRNGREYHVIERNYVISAEKSGDLSIPPAHFRGRIAVPQQQRTRRPRSPMDEFFANSPFANDPFASPSKSINVRGHAINMTIRPRPAAATHPWLPAETIKLGDSWTENPPQFMVGEPVSRTITIQVRGLSGSQIPELNIAEPANARVYPEAPTQENRTDGKTIYGIRTRTLTYIPGAQGILEIAPVTLKWWDTLSDKPSSSTLPAWQFNVLPGASGTENEAQAASPQPTTQAPAKTGDNNESAIIIHEIVPDNRHWLIISGGIFLALALLLVILALRAKRQQRTRMSATEQHNLPNRKATLRELEKACVDNNPHAATEALLKLGQAHWPDDPPRSLSALAARIETEQTSLRELDRSLYAADDSNWNGATLWDVFKHGLQEKKAARRHHDDGLKPLYPDSL